MAGVKFAIPQRGPPQAQQGVWWTHNGTYITMRASDLDFDDIDFDGRAARGLSENLRTAHDR